MIGNTTEECCVVIGGVECVIFTFEPVAWYFKPSHSIRLSLAGADESNFRWDKTRVKEDADFLTLSLLSKVGSTSRLIELQQQPLHIGRPQVCLHIIYESTPRYMCFTMMLRESDMGDITRWIS